MRVGAKNGGTPTGVGRIEHLWSNNLSYVRRCCRCAGAHTSPAPPRGGDAQGYSVLPADGGTWSVFSRIHRQCFSYDTVRTSGARECYYGLSALAAIVNVGVELPIRASLTRLTSRHVPGCRIGSSCFRSALPPRGNAVVPGANRSYIQWARPPSAMPRCAQGRPTIDAAYRRAGSP